MGVANTDAFAATGHTDNGRRASTGFTCGASFWVHNVEDARDAPAASRRRNPTRAARRPAVRELSSSEVRNGEIDPNLGAGGEGIDSSRRQSESRESGLGGGDERQAEGPERSPENSGTSGALASGSAGRPERQRTDRSVRRDSQGRSSSPVREEEGLEPELGGAIDGGVDDVVDDVSSAGGGVVGGGSDTHESDQEGGFVLDVFDVEASGSSDLDQERGGSSDDGAFDPQESDEESG